MGPFINPGEEGTTVKADAKPEKIIPIFIKKEDQILISILPKDFSFVMGENLSRVFHSFMINGIKVNLVLTQHVFAKTHNARVNPDCLQKNIHSCAF